MKILNIDTDCTDNGIGLRTTIYVAGCWHFCKGCHNPFSWNENHGEDLTTDEILDIILENELADVTISGGDPLTFQYDETLKLVKTIKERTNKNIWLYTGFTFDEVYNLRREILEYIDVLVDGKFQIENRDLTLRFRGSSNQKIINVKNALTNAINNDII